jgi:cyanate permease
LIFIRRSPEEMGLLPDGMDVSSAPVGIKPKDDAKAALVAEEAIWTWRQVIRTKAFWIICFIYGMANVGIAGLNLHVFAYVTDIGFPPLVAATVLSIIASTQLGSTMVWGLISERLDIRHSSFVMFLVQSTGLALVLAAGQAIPLYIGFFLYGIGLGGSSVLQELIWASNFGRISLGMVRGLGVLVTYAFGAAGAPFFGFVHDATGSYRSSFLVFVVALIASAFLSLAVRAPRKNSAPAS